MAYFGGSRPIGYVHAVLDSERIVDRCTRALPVRITDHVTGPEHAPMNDATAAALT